MEAARLRPLIQQILQSMVLPAQTQISAIAARVADVEELAPTYSVSIVAATGDVTWSSMPAAQTFLLGSIRHVRRIDLSAFDEVRLVAQRGAATAAAGATLALLYAATFATAVGSYTSILSLPVATADAMAASAWTALPAGAQGDVYLAVAGSGGDGAENPTFGVIEAQFR